MEDEKKFVHLHVHSDNSLLDGGASVDKLITRAKDLNMDSLALTDHGVMYGAWEFQEKAKKAGIKPIIGMEAYLAPGHRADKTAKTPGGKDYYHLVLLAKNKKGYHNLAKISSLAFKEGFYYKPRLDRELLEQYGEGLIVSSACLAGEVAQWIEKGDESKAREAIEWYSRTFKDRYYLEVQGHDSQGQAEHNAAILRLGDEMGIPVVATNDTHFLSEDDHAAHDVLTCIGLKKDRDDPSRLHYDKGLYFKSGNEMAERFPDRPDVLENTVKIASQVEIEFEKRYYVPNFPIEEERKEQVRQKVESGEAFKNPYIPQEDLNEEEKEQRVLEAALLRELSYEGARGRYGEELPEDVVERLEYELSIISRPETDYSGYHLITQDFINWAKNNDIPVGPGRGSAAGSIVCYSLGITDVDPLEYDLLFERFLNPDRVSMPDIDVDFDYERRGEVIDYVKEKYGEEAVCQIVTFGTMKARAVVKDVGRTLGFEPRETDALAKMIPNAPNHSLTVEEAIDEVADIRRLYDTDPRYRELLDYAKRLEGLRRHASTHAAGVVIAPGPVDEHVPVAIEWSTNDKGERVGSAVAQYDMNALEKAGMLKFDFLGLKTLTVIRDACQMAETRNEGLKLEPLKFDKKDSKVYQLFQKGKTAGIFQMESNLATEKLAAMRADSFHDLVAINALLRPGPLESGMTDKYIQRKRGLEDVDYPHPLLEEPLKNTYGIIVYQEQVMRAAQLLAGYTLAEADVMRKAVGKKDAELIEKEIKKFISRCVEKGTTDRRQAEEIGALIRTFGRYGFNLSHSVAYAELAFQTAYLKAHYPGEFMAALLSAEIGNTDKTIEYLGEARELGIPVKPPSVQKSSYKFTADDRDEGEGVAIRFGLGAIRGVGESVVNVVLDARKDGPFEDFFDFVKRVGGSGKIGRGALESLIYAGACDEFEGNRAQHLAAVDSALGVAAQEKKEQETGQINLFGAAEEAGIDIRPQLKLPDLPPLKEDDRLSHEKEAIGMYASGHPLEQVAEIAKVVSTHPIKALKEYQSGDFVLAGILSELNVAIAKRSGKPWAKGKLEDLSGTIPLLIFPDSYEKFKTKLQKNAPLVIRGDLKEDSRDTGMQPDLVIRDVFEFEEALGMGGVSLKLKIDEEAINQNDASLAAVKQIFAANPGNSHVFVEYIKKTGEPVRMRSANSKVLLNSQMLSELRAVIGDERVELMSKKERTAFLAEARAAQIKKKEQGSVARRSR